MKTWDRKMPDWWPIEQNGVHWNRVGGEIRVKLKDGRLLESEARGCSAEIADMEGEAIKAGLEECESFLNRKLERGEKFNYDSKISGLGKVIALVSKE